MIILANLEHSTLPMECVEFLVFSAYENLRNYVNHVFRPPE